MLPDGGHRALGSGRAAAGLGFSSCFSMAGCMRVAGAAGATGGRAVGGSGVGNVPDLCIGVLYTDAASRARSAADVHTRWSLPTTHSLVRQQVGFSPLQAKVVIRELLPNGLREPISKVRSSVAYAVSAVAHWDWPEAWPQLFSLLMDMLVSGDLHAVHGAMRVLTGTDAGAGALSSGT